MEFRKFNLLMLCFLFIASCLASTAYKPAQTAYASTPGGNLLSNPGFESGTTDWDIVRGDIFSSTNEDAYSGSKSLKVTGIGSDYHQNAYQYDVPVAPNTDYTLSVQLKGDMNVQLTIDWDTSKAQAFTPSASGWNRYELTFNSGNASDIAVVIQNAGITGTTYVDDISLVESASEDGPLTNPGFENGTVDWDIIQSDIFSASSEESFSGSGSLKVTGDNSDYYQNAIQWDVPVTPNTDYQLSGYMKGTMNIQLVIDWDTSKALAVTPAADGWERYTLKFNSGSNSHVAIVIQNAGITGTTYVDDLSLYPNVITNPGFEASPALTDWNLWNNSGTVFSATSGDKRSGANAVVINPAGIAYKGIYHADTAVEPNRYYRYTVYAKGHGAIQLVVNGVDSGTNIAAVSHTPSIGQWTPYSVSFNTGANTKVTLAIQNVETDSAKYTYIDDLSCVRETQPEIEEDLISLGEYLTRPDQFGAGLKVGAAVMDFPQSESNLSNKLNSPALIAKHFNSLTPGNEGKMPVILSIQPGQPAVYSNMSYNFAPADKIFDFAQQNGMKVRFTTFDWFAGMDDYAPWFFKDDNGNTVSAATLKTRLRTYIHTVMQHFLTEYPGMIYQWDVVNEAIDYVPNGSGVYPLRVTGNQFQQILGDEHVALSFQYAKEARDLYATTAFDQNAKLYYNDFGMEIIPAKQDAIYNLVQGLIANGVPVEGVGMQFHVHLGQMNAQWMTGVDALLTRFEQLGTEISITELDISVIDDTDTTLPMQTRLIRQAYAAKDLFDVFKAHKNAIKNITFWGTTDDTSWLNTYLGARDDRGLLFDKHLKAKYMYYAITGQMSKVPPLQ